MHNRCMRRTGKKGTEKKLLKKLVAVNLPDLMINISLYVHETQQIQIRGIQKDTHTDIT